MIQIKSKQLLISFRQCLVALLRCQSDSLSGGGGGIVKAPGFSVGRAERSKEEWLLAFSLAAGFFGEFNGTSTVSFGRVGIGCQ